MSSWRLAQVLSLPFRLSPFKIIQRNIVFEILLFRGTRGIVGYFLDDWGIKHRGVILDPLVTILIMRHHLVWGEGISDYRGVYVVHLLINLAAKFLQQRFSPRDEIESPIKLCMPKITCSLYWIWSDFSRASSQEWWWAPWNHWWPSSQWWKPVRCHIFFSI